MFTAERIPDGVIFRQHEHLLRVHFVTPGTARITYTHRTVFLDRPSRIVTAAGGVQMVELREDAQNYFVSAGNLTVAVAKENGALRYYATDGSLLTREPDEAGRTLTSKPILRAVFDANATVAMDQTVDGARVYATQH